MDPSRSGAAGLWDDVRDAARGVEEGSVDVAVLLAAVRAADPVLGRLQPDLADLRGVSYDHTAACGEIVEWRRTGLYRGTALKGLAASFPPSRADDRLPAAELAVVGEALRRCASLRADVADRTS